MDEWNLLSGSCTLVFELEPCDFWSAMGVKMWFSSRAKAEDYARVAWLIGFGLNDAQGRATGTHIAPSQIKNIRLVQLPREISTLSLPDPPVMEIPKPV